MTSRAPELDKMVDSAGIYETQGRAQPKQQAIPKPVTISNGTLTATFSPLGATLRDLRMSGVPHPLILGWGTDCAYLENDDYLGPLVGRCANRISGGAYSLGNTRYYVDRNFRGRHTLHGGVDGVDKQIWTVEALSATEVTLSLLLDDGHMGFGGDLRIKAHFRILHNATLSMAIEARSSGRSLCNIAPHWYFNLDGQGDIKAHTLQVFADSYLPVDGDLIPTGSVPDVQGTAFDFRQPREIGDFPYDHNFCTATQRVAERPVACLASEKSGVQLEISSTEPGLQVYSGAYLDQPDKPTLTGSGYGAYAGIALEPQCWPDAPNNADFPNVVLNEGEVYRHQSSFSFGYDPAMKSIV